MASLSKLPTSDGVVVCSNAHVFVNVPTKRNKAYMYSSYYCSVCTQYLLLLIAALCFIPCCMQSPHSCAAQDIEKYAHRFLREVNPGFNFSIRWLYVKASTQFSSMPQVSSQVYMNDCKIWKLFRPRGNGQIRQNVISVSYLTSDFLYFCSPCFFNHIFVQLI